MAFLLLIPSIVLAYTALGFARLMVREVGKHGVYSDPVRHAVMGACCAAGAIALGLIATGRPA
ncbi:hypothetical protein MKK75_03100 [Methylobacterium sp. J-030]|uniref:hypothetical protein n=1 Tax=Methylobacterium sp. J-030 TaxID=2836627 RepID=UPI001FBA561C|nr:hypothetical protein [Methylobacterium sp. J-030]MCJ2067803.1 hypothetical protein [Methylobacterium sp. J-030]